MDDWLDDDVDELLNGWVAAWMDIMLLNGIESNANRNEFSNSRGASVVGGIWDWLAS